MKYVVAFKRIERLEINQIPPQPKFGLIVESSETYGSGLGKKGEGVCPMRQMRVSEERLGLDRRVRDGVNPSVLLLQNVVFFGGRL